MKAANAEKLAYWVLFACFLTFGCGGGEKKEEGAAASKEETAAETTANDQPTGPVGTIVGTVTFDGEVPKLKILNMDAEPACAAKHTEPVRSQALVLGDGNTLANVFVKIKSGLPEKKWAPPSEPVVLDQNGCIYDPHVFAVMVGQPLKILNSDGILHNIHPIPKINRSFNFAMPKTVKEAVRKFKKVEEEPFPIKCDVHPWMLAYMAVMSHPFYSVTGKDGKFTIENVPEGNYELEAWHEKLGTLTAPVNVSANETVTVEFVFKRSN